MQGELIYSTIRRASLAVAAALFLMPCLRALAQEGWVPTGGPMASQVTAVEFDPGGVLYAGTFYSGLFRSEDGGESWEDLGLRDYYIRGIVFDADGRIVLGTYGDGVLQSTDRGDSWRELNLGLTDHDVQSLARDDSGLIMAGTFGGGVFVLESGIVWRHASEGLIDYDVRSVAFDGQGHVYVACKGAGIWESTDQGLSWSLFQGGSPLGVLRTVTASGNLVLAGAFNGGVAWTHRGEGMWEHNREGLGDAQVWTVAVTPEGDMLAGTHGDGLFRFDRSAAVWQKIGLDGDIVSAIKSGPQGRTWAGTRTGLYVAEGSSEDWSLAGVPRSTVFGLLASDSGTLIAATQESGLFWSEDHGATWVPSNIHFEHAFSVASDGTRLYAGGEYGRIFASDDDGRTWRTVSRDPDDEKVFSGVWSLTAQRHQILAGTAGEGVLRSRDRGESWTRAGLSGETVRVLVTDPAGRVFAGTETGLFVDENGEGPWLRVTHHPFTETASFSALVDPDGRVIIGTGMGAYASEDGGITWEPAGLGTEVITSLMSGLDGWLYAGTARGVWSKAPFPDTSWTTLPGLQDQLVWALETTGDENGGFDLLAATHTDGVWRHRVEITGTAPPYPSGSFALGPNYPNPFSVSTTIAFSLSVAGHVRLVVHDLQGRKTAVLLDAFLPAGRHQASWNPGRAASGIYSATLESTQRRETRALVLVR